MGSLRVHATLLAAALASGACTVEGGAAVDTARPDGPAPVIDLLVSEVDFGLQRMGQEPAPREVWIANTGDAPLEILDLTAPDEAAGFFLGTSLAGVTLRPGTEDSFLVRWLPNRLGVSSGEIFLATNITPPGQAFAIPVRGEAITGRLTASPETLRIEGGTTSRLAVELTNTGRDHLSISDVQLLGDAGLGLDLDPGRNGELPFELSPVDEDSGLPKRIIYVTWDPDSQDGSGDGELRIHNDGYLDRVRTLPIVIAN